MTDYSQERRARNEVIFREANEQIRTLRDEFVGLDANTPFVCECDDEACRTIIRLTLPDYEAIRAHPTRFAIANGHGSNTATLIGRNDGYFVIEKHGLAGEIAEAHDPRGAD
jgi:hypothetical protein